MSINLEAIKIEFDRAYGDHSDAIFRHLYYRLQDRDRALELTQEVFTRYWQYLGTGKNVENPRAFLYRSASNAFANEIRTPRRTSSLDDMLDSGFDVAGVAENKEELAAQKEAVERMNSLEPSYRDVLVMRYIDQMKIGEIAEFLGKSERTVSERIKQGMEILRQQYDNE